LATVEDLDNRKKNKQLQNTTVVKACSPCQRSFFTLATVLARGCLRLDNRKKTNNYEKLRLSRLAALANVVVYIGNGACTGLPKP
jgi:hypothetical protein